MRMIAKYFQRTFFFVLGFSLTILMFYFLYSRDFTAAAFCFISSFLSYFYSNLTKFKRFKGLGLEAELWEDKQEEAANLMDRLSKYVSIFSSEILMERAKSNRWTSGNEWREIWELYSRLGGISEETIDHKEFQKAKALLDDYYLFDLYQVVSEPILKQLRDAHHSAHGKMESRFGKPIQDVKGWNAALREWQNVPREIGEPFPRVKAREAGAELKKVVELASQTLKKNYDVTLDIPEVNMKWLDEIVRLEVLDSIPMEEPHLVLLDRKEPF